MAGSKRSRDDNDDAALWERVAKTVTPLRRRKATAASPPPPEADAPPQPHQPSPRKRRKASKLAPEAPPSPPPAPPPSPEPVVRGRTPGLDRRTADRFRRGQLPIEARLDLHGHRREDAHHALVAFLNAAHANGHRCLLVITGKGARSTPDDFGRAGEGVLRREVPRWLRDPSVAPLVLSTAMAQPRDGGSGALYILLRRRR